MVEGEKEITEEEFWDEEEGLKKVKSFWERFKTFSLLFLFFGIALAIYSDVTIEDSDCNTCDEGFICTCDCISEVDCDCIDCDGCDICDGCVDGCNNSYYDG